MAAADPEGARPWGVPSSIAHIAPDPLEPAYDQAAVVARLKARDSAVKRALLDQTLVSGIGNIYADEALWRARLHGERARPALTRPAPRAAARPRPRGDGEALGQGGTSFDALYVNVNGASGLLRPLAARLRPGGPALRRAAARRSGASPS